MLTGDPGLTEKEKQTLRLIVRGHDAKSLARHLGLSVHTVNERLRDARRKLGVSSSREAARLLFERESATPDSLTDKQMGEADRSASMRQSGRFEARRRTGSILAAAAGGTIMLLSLATLALMGSFVAPSGESANPAGDRPAAAAATARSEPREAALRWLALVDRYQWQESWAATASSFRQNNTAEAWESASLVARVPLGAVLERTELSQEQVPAPPHGYRLIKFRTSFSSRRDVIETLALVREGEDWRVVGYLID